MGDHSVPRGDAGLVQASRQGAAAQAAELPVLLTSGYAEAARRDADAEGVRILPKPYLLAELAAALQTARDQNPAGEPSVRAH